MYVENLVLELMYFMFLVGGCFAVICLIILGTIRAIVEAIGYEVVQAKNWLTKWSNK